MESLPESAGADLVNALTLSNLLLLVATVVTLAVWLVQELARAGQQRAFVRGLEQGVAAGSLPEPGWSEWAWRGVVLLWFVWLAAALLLKDGDFAFVLVLLTLLAGLIGAADRWGFERSRLRTLQAGPVQQLLQRTGTGGAQQIETDLVGQRPIAEYSRSFFPVLAVVVILRSFVIEPFQIPSSSMVPTLEVGDYIVVNKFTYGLRLPVVKTKILDIGEPQRGDVVVFFPPGDTRYFIKRLIGLPGDQIEYRDKVLYINGEEVEQKLMARLPPLRPVVEMSAEKLGSAEHLIYKDLGVNRGDFSTVVQPGHYFMMGDNRDNSSDSRYWGQVPDRNIVGKAFAIWMHWESIGSLPSFDRVGTIR
ncbi:MAG: signal peptidase I [Spongiibacteraceae bacterium]|jgi:signal peptidase I|nr:signal peptidase I [Spongiibacteraceae bacterium]